MGPTYNCNICWFFCELVCLDHLVNLYYLCYVIVWLFMYITLLRINQIDKLEILFVKIWDGTVVAQNIDPTDSTEEGVENSRVVFLKCYMILVSNKQRKKCNLSLRSDLKICQ